MQFRSMQETLGLLHKNSFLQTKRMVSHLKNSINNGAVIIFFCIILLILIFFHFRGITYFDEGYILNAALRTSHGQIAYRDFDMAYTPLSFTVAAAFLNMFGESVFAERMSALIISILSVIGLIYLQKTYIKDKRVLLAAILFFVSWGPTHINFAWPVMFAICCLLYAMLFYMQGITKKSTKWFFLSGLMTFLIFLSKQNFGVGAFAALSFSFFLIPISNKKNLLLNYILGVLFLTTVYVLYLVATQSMQAFMQNLDLYTLKRIIIDKQLDTPFLYEGTLFARFGKFIFYISPFIIAAIAFWTVYKKHKKMLFIPFVVAIFYLLGVRPTTDYIHVAPLIALACLPLTMIIVYSKNGILRGSMIGFLLVYIVVGFYTAYFKGYYQWEAAMKDYTYFASDNRLLIYLKQDQSTGANALQKYIDKKTKKDEYIFVNYYAPLVYFLADRRNPTPYDLISTNQLPVSYQKDIINIIQKKKVKLVILHELNKDENSLVSNYIRKNYRYTNTINHFVIFEK
jgi:hypothetical protein